MHMVCERERKEAKNKTCNRVSLECASDFVYSSEHLEVLQYKQLEERELNWVQNDIIHAPCRQKKQEIIFSQHEQINTEEFMKILCTSSAFDIDEHDTENECSVKKKLIFELRKRGLQCMQACRIQRPKPIQRFMTFYEDTKPNIIVRMYQVGARMGMSIQNYPLLYTTHDAAIQFARENVDSCEVTIDLVAVVVLEHNVENVCSKLEYEPIYSDETCTEYRIWYRLHDAQELITEHTQSQTVNYTEKTRAQTRNEGCSLHWLQEKYEARKMDPEIILPFRKRMKLV